MEPSIEKGKFRARLGATLDSTFFCQSGMLLRSGCRLFASVASHDASARLAAAVTPAVYEQLSSHGYAVVDNCLSEDHSAALRAEIVALHEGKHTLPNATLLVRGNVTEKLAKAGIFEAEAHALSDAARELAPRVCSFAADRTLLTLLTAYAANTRAQSLHFQSVKLQFSSGSGACFPLHYDTDESLDGRKITAISYLNPGWEPSHGGELVLYPSPLSGAAVTIAPLSGRLVLFHAPSSLHRVRPSFVPRACVTQWLFSRDAAATSSSSSSGELGWPPRGDCTLATLHHPKVVKHAAKAVRRSAWAASLVAAHPHGSALNAALSSLHSDVSAIEAALEGRYAGAREMLRALRDRAEAQDALEEARGHPT